MILIWAIFALLLFVIETLHLHRRMSEIDISSTGLCEDGARAPVLADA